MSQCWIARNVIVARSERCDWYAQLATSVPCNPAHLSLWLANKSAVILGTCNKAAMLNIVSRVVYILPEKIIEFPRFGCHVWIFFFWKLSRVDSPTNKLPAANYLFRPCLVTLRILKGSIICCSGIQECFNSTLMRTMTYHYVAMSLKNVFYLHTSFSYDSTYFRKCLEVIC